MYAAPRTTCNKIAHTWRIVKRGFPPRVKRARCERASIAESADIDVVIARTAMLDVY